MRNPELAVAGMLTVPASNYTVAVDGAGPGDMHAAGSPTSPALPEGFTSSSSLHELAHLQRQASSALKTAALEAERVKAAARNAVRFQESNLEAAQRQLLTACSSLQMERIRGATDDGRYRQQAIHRRSDQPD